ncbi:MAG: CoA-binding protein [Deltaproteobacteria bacterium]|nr:CoA-binding protein [Deltaproteobacteria bacterium]
MEKDEDMNRLDLDKLFNPQNIAFVGASANPPNWAYIILFNVLKANFDDTVYPINPGQEFRLGIKCYNEEAVGVSLL